MSAVSIRNLDDRVKERLRLRTARHGRPMEAEMRVILTEAVREPRDGESLVSALMDRYAELGGVEVDNPARHPTPRGGSLLDDRCGHQCRTRVDAASAGADRIVCEAGVPASCAPPRSRRVRSGRADILDALNSVGYADAM